MSNRENNTEEKLLDELIKEGVEMNVSNTEDISVPSDEELLEMGYSLPPEDMYDRVMSIVGEENNTADVKPVIRKRKWIKLIAVAAIVAVMLCGVLNVSAVRVYIYKLISEITDNAIYIDRETELVDSYEADDNTAYKNAEADLGVTLLKPSYLPDGFVFDSVKCVRGSCAILHYKRGDKIIKLTQTIIQETNNDLKALIDTKDGSTHNESIGGYDVMLATYVQEVENIRWYGAVWHDEKLKYEIDTNISEEELKKVIRGLK